MNHFPNSTTNHYFHNFALNKAPSAIPSLLKMLKINHFSYRLFNFFLIFQAIVTFFDVYSYFSEYNFFSPWFLFKVLVGTMLFRCLISIIFLKPRLSQQENDRIIKQKWQNNYFDYSHFCNYKTYWNMWTYLIVF